MPKPHSADFHSAINEAEVQPCYRGFRRGYFDEFECTDVNHSTLPTAILRSKFLRLHDYSNLRIRQPRIVRSYATRKIDPEAVSKDDVEMLQDLILAAINDAQRKAEDALQKQMGGMMGGLKIPGMF